ncbi:hypothetical protein BpHYR1_042202 [Brachionus plicatilis]|uniref:Uncharacterized protein n=1 Tax=Brachionus plicatilis TaxID=10195 RepID=A0A3M7SGR6_BRAPC|nr:hypothetical protein BpHYR1_042202 [Brachionus plicatilis]
MFTKPVPSSNRFPKPVPSSNRFPKPVPSSNRFTKPVPSSNRFSFEPVSNRFSRTGFPPLAGIRSFHLPESINSIFQSLIDLKIQIIFISSKKILILSKNSYIANRIFVCIGQR